MSVRSLQSLLAAGFTICILFFSTISLAQGEHGGNHDGVTEKKEKFDAAEVIFDHILDNHEFHFIDYKGSDGKKHAVSIPLPVILYSPQKGFSFFSSSRFEHGHKEYEGYKLEEGKIHAVDKSVKVYDFSLTRNVVQMMLALIILVVLLIRIANRYSKGTGVKTAPKGSQGLMEPVITFVRDEVAKPNLGHKADKYLPYLLTVFFFILINNIFGLIPGSANVTGNIAFTVILGIISFVVILASSRSHYWGHIFNPPGVPLGIKFILVPVEVLSLFIKPMALIIRLFANMVAGHIIIICLISLIFIFAEMHPAAGWGSSLISVAFTIFIYFIEVLVAFLQAFIFTMLTAVFIGQAFEGSHDDVDHHDDKVIV
jgi:F-type H+-transporting ATPase subunit a